MQTDCADVNVVDDNAALTVFDHAKESQREAALAGACATHDADLFARLNVEAQVAQNVVQFVAVLQKVVGEADVAERGPLFGGLLFWRRLPIRLLPAHKQRRPLRLKNCRHFECVSLVYYVMYLVWQIHVLFDAFH